METNSHPEAAASNVKQGQYSPRKRKDTAPRVNPQLAVELVYQELKRVEVYTKRIEDATARKVQIDGKSLESAENRLKNVLADFERQGYRMKNGGYVDKRISFYSILCAVISLLFACFMCYLWTDAAKDRDNYKQYYEYYQEQAREQRGINKHLTLRIMGTTEHEEPRFFFILNKGAKSGGEITHAVLNGSIVSKPAGWDAFHGLALAREKLSSEEIQQQMKELGVEMEIVPLI